MLKTLLSNDTPRSKILTIVVLVIFLGLALAPFLFPGVRSLDTAARIAIFIVLAASYDLLLGYTGVVSFAHTMFFGMGAYGVGLASLHMGRGFHSIIIGSLAGAALAAAFAFLIALFSLRVRAIFFAMITLAVASAVAVLVSQLSWLTGGEDGFTFKIPRELGPANRMGEFLGVKINGKLLNYYLIFTCSLLLFLLMLRVVNSPFGRVLQAIRENDFRAEAIGYRVVWYRTVATCLSAATAALAGSLFALWLRYVGPDTTLSFTIMLDLLLMVVIGGMGTIWGAAVGATLLVLAQTYLQDLMGSAATATEFLPLLSRLLDPDRWLLWLGVLFILSVYFFPTGIVGRLRGSK
ncbi:leucine/isoleucine/valine transporter permease subunit [Pelagimonas phthalicica]|uniref:Leucine/isoleucine/valine transporter permease subunit n=1 Tax=Pelagimonas phthalicica TaxID=1037362 RepID=A0A238JIL3_9RHOB|nr:branched-chain amino acid ABC transporter permease [Pelagimonas phthalicica]TDS88424.1 amino acid/amide ABC transporter membrane protein 2 (HAAT family) [Pelagimonas phthalicica]SMX30510.1 leucine/isoleucine/valine transporter permease subunit [Pelagimonas phthalicica]